MDDFVFEDKEKPKVKYTMPPNILKMKAGHGGIPEENILRADKFISAFKADFEPIARNFLEQLQTARKNLQKTDANENALLLPVMHLKANGGMFQYHLISDIADICLQFLEAIEEYNDEAIEIIKAHEQTIQIILDNKLKGNGGKEGYELVKELHQACSRYFKKHGNTDKAS